MNKQFVVDFENVLKKHKAIQFEKVWSKVDSAYKLIYNIEGMSVADKFYPSVKLILWLDASKDELIENVVTYLHSFYCDYKSISMTTAEETFHNILAILDKEKTNMELSDLVISGTEAFNQELRDNKHNVFIQNLSMLPTGNMPCVKMRFKFELKSNDESYEFYLKCFKTKWELTYKQKQELVDITDVPKKLIKMIYDTDRDNV